MTSLYLIKFKEPERPKVVPFTLTLVLIKYNKYFKTDFCLEYCIFQFCFIH